MIAVAVCIQFGNFSCLAAARSPDLVALGREIGRKWRAVMCGLEWRWRRALLPLAVA